MIFCFLFSVADSILVRFQLDFHVCVCVPSALLQKEKADQLIRESKQAQRARQDRQLAYVQATLARTQGEKIFIKKYKIQFFFEWMNEGMHV